MDIPDPDTLLAEQIEYYRARAPEYDDWWLRIGRYEPDDEFGVRWEQGKRDVAAAVATFEPRGDVLEIAAGTGNLTLELCRSADHVTAIDASAEALAVAATKLADKTNVDFTVADVFDWRPKRRFDVVAFGFWLSHVPPARTTAFWNVVDAALKPSGRVFFVDNAIPVEQAHPASATPASGDGRNTPWSQTWLDRGVSLRTLADGRRFHIVKRGWTTTELERELSDYGWTANVEVAQGLFLHGTASRATPNGEGTKATSRP